MKTEETKTTIEYYNNNAEQFVDTTKGVDFANFQMHFLSKLPHGGKILDFGCGSGRDTRYFLNQGYRVVAIDGSERLCKLASEYTGISVKNMLFQELADVESYDGVWACSSILHLPYDDLKEVMKKIATALKEQGIFYTSFKYGTFEGKRNGRYYTDMSEEKFADLVKVIPVFEMEEQWVTTDVRPEREEEKWLNVMLRKI